MDSTPGQLATLSRFDSARAFTRILLPSVLKGPILRRPAVVGLAQRLDADTAGVKEIQRLHARYGRGPVQFTLLGRRVALLLDAGDVRRVLTETPDPFTPATLEKRGALNHFEPDGSLVSTPHHRLARRPFNERVLQTPQTMHDSAGAMIRAVDDEVDALLGHVDFTGDLDWDAFAIAWWRIVRRIVLGDRARDDHAVRDELQRLRSRANFAYLEPQRARLRARFLRRLQGYVDRAEPGSLAAVVAQTPAGPETAPVQQMPQWLFAFDAAAWATFRALSLLAAHPGAIERARAEIPDARELPYLRATVLESLRLWPTTPLLLRDTTAETTWPTGSLAPKTAVVTFAPYFHRDDRRLADAHTFNPDRWLDAGARHGKPAPDGDEGLNDQLALVPFSGGPGACPGRNIVLLVASRVLARLVESRDFAGRQRLPVEHLPGTLSPFAARFEVRPRKAVPGDVAADARASLDAPLTTTRAPETDVAAGGPKTDSNPAVGTRTG